MAVLGGKGKPSEQLASTAETKGGVHQLPRGHVQLHSLGQTIGAALPEVHKLGLQLVGEPLARVVAPALNEVRELLQDDEE